jgi:hypothetical protein
MSLSEAFCESSIVSRGLLLSRGRGIFDACQLCHYLYCDRCFIFDDAMPIIFENGFGLLTVTHFPSTSIGNVIQSELDIILLFARQLSWMLQNKFNWVHIFSISFELVLILPNTRREFSLWRIPPSNKECHHLSRALFWREHRHRDPPSFMSSIHSSVVFVSNHSFASVMHVCFDRSWIGWFHIFSCQARSIRVKCSVRNLLRNLLSKHSQTLLSR